MSNYRIGIDVGGTFTDIVALDDGRLHRRKIRSTSDDFSTAVLEGLHALLTGADAEGSDVTEVIHGTTVVTNAIIEKKGAPTGLITTAGFRDILEIGRLRTPRLYDLSWRKPPPLVARELRREADERIQADGSVFKPLDEESLMAAAEALISRGVTSIAICFINSFANPEHERRAVEVVHSAWPEIALSVSHQVLPEMREYERTSTTVINAYVQPLVDGYLRGLESGLTEMDVDAPLLVMQSNGGIMGAAQSREKPIYMVESGPAVGVMGSLHMGRRLGHDDIISFDMGGTTAKAATIQQGRADLHSEYEVGGDLHLGHHLLRGGGYMLRVPSIGIAEVGAGGGSIVWIDDGGVIQVGPESAGAQPGPACYGAGGDRPTITDAAVALGYLNPEFLVGGELPLDAGAAHRAIEDNIAAPLGIDVTDAAYGVFLVANSRMVRAVRAVTSEKGRDPSGFTMYAFGGGGPMHAVEMARQVNIGEIVVPPAPGLFSSLGLLFADVEHHYVRTLMRDVPEGLNLAESNAMLETMDTEAAAALREEGYPRERVELIWQADMRYESQQYQLPVALPAGQLTAADPATLEEGFHREHDRTFGYRSEEQVQLVNLRLIARGVPEEPRMPDRLTTDPGVVTASSRRAYFGTDHSWVETPVIAREELNAETRRGPFIVEEYDATTVVPPGASARRDGWGNILITVNEREA